MPSLGDAYSDAADAWSGRRLYVGAALLFVGTVVAAPGLVRVTAQALEFAGVATATSLWFAIAVAGLAVPLVGAGLLRSVPSSRRLRAVGATGVCLAALAVAAYLVAVPPGSATTPGGTLTVVLLVYVTGALLALWSPIVAAGFAADGRRERAAGSSTFVRDRSPVRPAGRVPADGGEDEQQLAFLLDREKRK